MDEYEIIVAQICSEAVKAKPSPSPKPESAPKRVVIGAYLFGIAFVISPTLLMYTMCCLMYLVSGLMQR